MKKQEILTKLESDKSDTDYVLRTYAEDASFLENYKSSVIEQEIEPRISQVHTQYDEDMFSLFGRRKKSDQKTYHFLKEQFNELKVKADKVAELEGEITELKKGKPDDAKLQEIKDLQAKIAKLNADHDKEIKDFAEKSNRAHVKSEIEKARKEIKFKTGIPDSVLDVYFNKITDDLVQNAELRENTVVFLDAEKKARRNNATMAPYTAKEMLLETLPKDIIETEHKQEGVKLPKDQDAVTKGKDGKYVMNFTVPPEVKSRQKLGEWLVKEMGLKTTTPEYREAYKTLGENMPPVD